jgi:hypothetical protein
MMICAGLLVLGAILAAVFIPSRLPAHNAPEQAPPEKADEPWAPTPDSAMAATGATVTIREASPIHTFCDPAGPPVHPRH